MFHRAGDLEAQNELEQDLLDSMAPCCARDIKDMRRAADVTRRLREVDPTTKAVDARMALRNPSSALWNTKRRLFSCGDEACGDDCEHELVCEEQEGEDSDGEHHAHQTAARCVV